MGPGQTLLHLDLQLEAVLLEGVRQRPARRFDHLLELHRLRVIDLRIALDLGEVQDVVQKTRQALTHADDDFQEIVGLTRARLGLIAQRFSEHADRCQRRAQLVRHRRDELRAHLGHLHVAAYVTPQKHRAEQRQGNER